MCYAARRSLTTFCLLHTRWLSKNCSLFKQTPFSESLHAERFGIEEARFAVQDQFGDEASGRGRVHDAVTAEAVGEEEAAQRGCFADDRVMIGRHLVETSPRALRVDFRFRKTRHTRG